MLSLDRSLSVLQLEKEREHSGDAEGSDSGTHATSTKATAMPRRMRYLRSLSCGGCPQRLDAVGLVVDSAITVVREVQGTSARPTALTGAPKASPFGSIGVLTVITTGRSSPPAMSWT